jgi:protein SCO1/2
VGITERLGDFIPESVMLRDEEGRPVRLRDLLTVPTLLAPVYYSCPNDCNLLLMNLSKVLPQVGLAPGREFQVLTVSFDERDTPELASRRRKDFGQALRGGFPIEHWRFLTGDKANIDALMGAIGFSFQRTGDAFQHSVIMAAVSPGGKITRYLYGASPLPFDIAMAATEAAEGRTGLSVSRAVAFCYSYDPAGRRYVFDITKVAGATVLFGIFLFALFLVFGGRKRRGAGKDGHRAA